MRVYGSSRGIDATSLVPGEDLLLQLDEAHGADALEGTYAQDYLNLSLRHRLNDEALTALRRWRESMDAALTVDGTCLPWIWELHLFIYVFLRLARDTAGVREAIRQHQPPILELRGVDPFLAEAIRIVAAGLGVTVRDALMNGLPPPMQQPPARRRDAALHAVGIPSFVRKRAIVVTGYPSLAPLIDHMLKDASWRAACHLEMRPPGAHRVIRMAMSGGWMGTPSRHALRIARAGIREATARFPSVPVPLGNLDMGGPVHSAVNSLVRKRAAGDIARAALATRVFERSEPSLVVIPYDSTPESRVLMTAARRTGLRTLCVAHGGYWVRSPVMDLEESDEVAVWSEQPLRVLDRERPVHVVGYPRTDRPLNARRKRNGAPSRIAVLQQVPSPRDARMDARLTMRHYVTAVDAVRQVSPEAEIVLRPHPSAHPSTASSIAARYPQLLLRADSESDLLTMLASCDVCIGSISTATLEASVAGTEVIVLNVTGVDWPPPLGGLTSVPVARSLRELTSWLRRASAGETLPGKDALYEALGANLRHPHEALLRTVSEVMTKPVLLHRPVERN